MSLPNPRHSVCDSDRRRFLQASAASLVAVSIPRFAHAAPTRDSAAETVVAEFYQSLTPAQHKEICHPMSSELVRRVNPNWHVSKPLIGDDFYSDTQRSMIERIVRDVTSAEGFTRLESQMEDDDGGLQAYSVAMFGEPSTSGENAGPFQWLLTGRHLTLRADGNTVAGRAFGGPIIYGHGEESSAKENIFYYQTQRVNEVFASLSGDQTAVAMGERFPDESQINLQGDGGTFSGIAVADLAPDQQQLVRSVLGTLLAPYRDEDAREAMAIIEDGTGGGIGALRFAFFKDEDLQNDGIWDNWRIEGPNTVIHFRGAPHVHAYIHIADRSVS